MVRPLGEIFDVSDWTYGDCHNPLAGRQRIRAATTPCLARSTPSGRFLQGRDQDHRPRRQRLHARGPDTWKYWREPPPGGGESRHYTGRPPVRAAAPPAPCRDINHPQSAAPTTDPPAL